MRILMLFHQVDSGALTQPLWDSATVTTAYPSNYEFVRDYTIKLLGTSFPNMTPAEVGSFKPLHHSDPFYYVLPVDYKQCIE